MLEWKNNVFLEDDIEHVQVLRTLSNNWLV